MTISATIIKDSINKDGIRITTFELEYPRFIHSELMTHRCFSRNAASSRAIPIKVMHENIVANLAEPVEWGMNNPGMQSKQLATEDIVATAKEIWTDASDAAIYAAEQLADLGLHKQIANRISECYQHMKTIVTSTEWANWYELRNHGDADPTIHALAAEMEYQHTISIPVTLAEGHWHLPYVNATLDSAGQMWYSTKGQSLDLQTAKMISVSCCAQVSYRKNDTSIEKAKSIYERLVSMKPEHASPFEHQATPLDSAYLHMCIMPEHWPKGVTHMTKDLCFCSGNFRGWVQNRQLM